MAFGHLNCSSPPAALIPSPYEKKKKKMHFFPRRKTTFPAEDDIFGEFCIYRKWRLGQPQLD